jgi:hypothetical protein
MRSPEYCKYVHHEDGAKSHEGGQEDRRTFLQMLLPTFPDHESPCDPTKKLVSSLIFSGITANIFSAKISVNANFREPSP